MDSLFILIPIALVFCFVAIKLLLWAIDSGQYDDLDKEAYRILMDEEPQPAEEQEPQPPEKQEPQPPEEQELQLPEEQEEPRA